MGGLLSQTRGLKPTAMVGPDGIFDVTYTWEKKMTRIGTVRSALTLATALLVQGASGLAHAQATQVTTEYLMTYVLPVDPPIPIDASMLIAKLRPGGWVK